MDLALLGTALGAILGALAARRRRGGAVDMLWYAVIWGILGGLIGVVAFVIYARVIV